MSDFIGRYNIGNVDKTASTLVYYVVSLNEKIVEMEKDFWYSFR